MQRRNFITISAVAVTAVGITSIGCRQNHSEYEALLDKPEILSQICDLKTLREIGAAYRKQASSEANQDKLISLLLTDSAGTLLADPDKTYVHSLIRENINREFEAGQTVVVKGWVLSVTEARQCALLSINNPQ